MDDKVVTDELLAGAGAAAVAASLAELAGHQAGTLAHANQVDTTGFVAARGRGQGYLDRVRRAVAAAGTRRAAGQWVQ